MRGRVRLPKNLVAFIWHFLKPYHWQLLGLVLPMIYSAIHLSLEPYILKLLIDEVTAFKGDASEILSRFYPYSIIFFVQALLLVLAWRVKDYFALRILPSMKSQIIAELFEYVGNHSFRYYQENFAGNIANKIKEVSTGVEELIENIREVFRQTVLVLIATFMVLTVHPQLSIILFSSTVVFIGVGYLLSRNVIIRSETLAESRSVTFGKIVDSISNHANVRLFARNSFESGFLDRFLTGMKIEDRKLRMDFIRLWSVQGVLVCLMLGFMMTSLLYLRSRNLVTVGDFAMVMWLAVALIDQVWLLTETLSKMPQHIGVCRQGLSLINIPNEITDEPKSQELQVIQGEIEFKDVCFSYPESRILFDNLNLKILPGSKVGLVGSSGSGKSSFVHLLVRLFDLKSGCIEIDGQDIRSMTQKSLRENVSFIPQDPSLFHRSLMDNIRYGKINATDEEVIAAAKKAHAHDFILKTSHGYGSMVGERGIKLSGGQRQRIAIARAILKNAPILILDEATSALDSVTEALIQDALHELMRNKTTLVIAHRLSTLLEMDRILVFDQGQVAEDGSHEELIRGGGLYSILWNSQVGGFLQEERELTAP